MAFVRVNPSGWAFGAKLTSAQQNQLDIDHANSLDKTVAGDQLAGTVGMGAGAAILVNTAGAKIVSSVTNGIQSNVANGLVGGAAGAIASGVSGGIALTGGANDYPTFPSRFINRGRILRPAVVLPAAWNASTTWYLVGGATTGYVYCPLEGLIDGTTLGSVAIEFNVAGTHVGGAPANPPLVTIFRINVGNGGSNTVQTLNSGDPTTGLPFFNAASPPTGSAWYNGGFVQTFIYGCDQNNAISLEQYSYFVAIQDENGARSAGGNGYFSTFALSTVTKLAYD
jgi:hypothetical protein